MEIDAQTSNFKLNNADNNGTKNVECCEPLLLAPMSTSSEGNLYIVWPDNKTGNWDIFFVKSPDGGRTFDLPINLSNDGDFSGNPSIATNNNDIFVTWWDNSTGKLLPVIRSSYDGGKSFDSIRVLDIDGITGK
jgi:hypothetical protein